MTPRFKASLSSALCLSLLQMQVAFAAKDTLAVRAYVNDTCIIADEPFFLPTAPPKDGSEQATAKFLPLLGLVVGKLAELFINHEIQSSANRYKAGVARKDTRYAATRQMNLYRADFEPAPALSINAKLGCMTIVAANFKPDATECTAAYVPKELAKASVGLPQTEWKTSRTDDSIENQLRRADICVDGKIRAVYEARFEFSADGTAYRLKDAGYRIDSLLTTEKAGAARTVLYTLKISNPSATDQQEVLSSAWVNIGTIKAGARSHGSGGDAAPWLRVPPLSVEARRNFDEKTKVHQQVTGEIEALQRALTRNQRVLTGLDQRIAKANPEIVDGLKQERTRIAVQSEAQSAELDAQRAAYQDLPRAPLEFMPVTIEVAVTETESEKKAQVALAELVGSNSDLVASAVGNAATGLISKSASLNDIKIEPDPAELAGTLEHARAGYYDALVAAQTGSASSKRDLERNLALEKDKYNEARRLAGLEQIK
ncbi:MAG TPA: hypothetical protein VK743_18710 [Steroidobacteraceae bacterium]|jgi:hypothetical protein|nr:hypothetical protein [Steroidobacteraceae bacterium]